MKIKWKKLLGCLALPLAAGGVSAWISSGSMEDFARLNQPPLSPPGWLFPIVWTVLFILMGAASYLVLESKARQPEKRRALILYGVQLAVNFVWPILFFNLGLFLFAFIWLAALWILIIATYLLFHRASPAAGYLLLPYFLWVSFAAYLNFAIYLLN